MESEKKYFYNGNKIKDIQLLTIVSDISNDFEFGFLKSQLAKYIENSFENKYCLDFSKISSIDYISNSISVMMNFHRFGISKGKEIYFISNSGLQPYLEDSQLIEGLFDGDVFNSREDLENFLSK